MKKLYIFDMGGVVVQNSDVLPDIAAYLGISLGEVRTYGKDLFSALMSGNLNTQEFWAAFSQRAGHLVEEELFGKFFHPVVDQSVLALIMQLKEHNRVVCGTNTIEEHYTIHIEQGDYIAFDAVYASHRMGFVKPCPNFYQHIMEQEQFSPAQTIFIDDAIVNVEAAQKLGIQALHFTGYDGLIDQLKVSG